MVQVPTVYVQLVIGEAFSTQQAWEELAGAILSNGNKGPCEYLLMWLQVALTLSEPSGSATNQVPVTLLPKTAFPALAVDVVLQQHRWMILQQDFPALDAYALAPSNHMIDLVGSLRQERNLERAKDEARHVAATAPKLPS